MRALRRGILFISILAGCKTSEPPRPKTPGVYEVSVTARGYEPETIEVPAGKEITLRMTRQVEPSCGDAVDIEGDPVRHMLPLHAAVDIQVKAPASGQIAFACPMKMYRGAIVATSGK